MRRILTLPILLLAGCSAAEPEPFDAVVTFSVPVGEHGLANTEEATVFLDVAKSGRKSIVDAWQDDVTKDERYGRHKFPPYTTAPAMAAYYGPVLANAGWQKTDYRLEDSRLQFFGVTRLRAGASGSQIQVKVERLTPR